MSEEIIPFSARAGAESGPFARCSVVFCSGVRYGPFALESKHQNREEPRMTAVDQGVGQDDAEGGRVERRRFLRRGAITAPMAPPAPPPTTAPTPSPPPAP